MLLKCLHTITTTRASSHLLVLSWVLPFGNGICVCLGELHLTRGNDWELVTKVWVLQSFSTENLKSNKNVYLLFYLACFQILLYYSYRDLIKKNIECGQLCAH